MSVPRRVVVAAPAKINLGLEILGRRGDGYHEIDTTLVALDLRDELAVARRADGQGVTLALTGPAASPDVPRDATNLVVRAAAGVLELARETNCVPRRTGLDLELEKRIPSQAGLGGGSSDAAAAALGAALVLALPDRVPGWEALLGELLAGLGSDARFFFEARATGAARALGRGERVEPIALEASERRFVVVVPAIHCPTARVYRALDSMAPSRLRSPLDPARHLALPLEEARGKLFNRLEPAALLAVPALAGFLEGLRREIDAAFTLAGSGSAAFALVADAAAAEPLLEGLRRPRFARDHALRGAYACSLEHAGVTRLRSK